MTDTSVKIQSRVPAGSSAGGQFGRGGGGAGAANTGGNNASTYLDNAANAQDNAEHGGTTVAGENLESASRSVQREVDKWPEGGAKMIADSALKNVDWNGQSRASASADPTGTTSFLVTSKGSDGRVIAVADVHVSSANQNVQIENFAVNPSAGGRGVGTQTMGRIASFAERNGQGVSLDAVTTSVTFFQNLGFKKVGNTNNAYELQNMVLSPANTRKLASSTRVTKKYELEPADGVYCKGRRPRRKQNAGKMTYIVTKTMVC